MKAMVLKQIGKPLSLEDILIPEVLPGQVRIKITACGVCRTDLHIIDGELTQPKLPLIPGHEIVGRICEIGKQVEGLKIGDRVGVPWLGSTCGDCYYCLHEKENLCDEPGFTGYTMPGGYAEYVVANEQYTFLLNNEMDDFHVAPLLCAGLIGYRSYRMLGENKKRIGIYGFGAAAHILTQIAISQGCEIYAFTRPGDKTAQKFALEMGSIWAGGSDQSPPILLDGTIIFAPVGSLIPQALRSVRKGGVVICGGIHMSEIPAFSYGLLWEERTIKSVANLTRQDGIDFFKLIRNLPVQTNVTVYSLNKANQALIDLRQGNIPGAAVLNPQNIE